MEVLFPLSQLGFTVDFINFEWVMALWIPASIVFGFAAIFLLRRIKAVVTETLLMHRKPDEYGFGIGPLESIASRQMNILREQRDCMRELVSLVRWESEERTGKKAPPFVRPLADP